MEGKREWKAGDRAMCRGWRVKLIHREESGAWFVGGIDGGQAFYEADESELGPVEPTRTRTLVLVLDDLDYAAIQREIAGVQSRSRAICPDVPTILPDGDSNLAGAILAMTCRAMEDVRKEWDRENRP